MKKSALAAGLKAAAGHNTEAAPAPASKGEQQGQDFT